MKLSEIAKYIADNYPESNIAYNNDVIKGCREERYEESLIDPLINEYYLDIETMIWDSYNEDFFHDKEYINYCPWCGRKLTKE